MSYLDAKKPECDAAEGPVALRIEPREKDLGEFTVRRVLPAARNAWSGHSSFSITWDRPASRPERASR